MKTFESLQYRDFRWIWIGQTTHALALWAQMIALPLCPVRSSRRSGYPTANGLDNWSEM